VVLQQLGYFIIGLVFAAGIPLGLVWVAAKVADWMDKTKN